MYLKRELIKFQLVLIFLLLPVILSAQSNSSVFVDEEGILRWEKNKEEVKGFGVNYTVPFAHVYRSGKKMNLDLKKVIDNDVYHFNRLGFDLYRIHIWDTQISDSIGNLLENEHLKLFDYLIKKLNEYDINYVLTPIAFWGNGWPEPDTYTPGFSHKYGKDDCLTDPDCISAQVNYLTQFMNHKNPYTGFTYKNDPSVIAVEVSNEPHHRAQPEDVTQFVRKMVNAIKASGTQKPIFYNGSHAVHLTENYFEGGVEGGTFQWYPTGLGYQREIPGNLLPNVNDYNIPFNSVYEENKGAKIVYEFDAADVGKTYIYPAMARSFRSAGIQIATHFSYDPTFLAPYNTEYNTHYMNLAYTPGKAISLMISGEVFHKIPMKKDFGKYPANKKFDDFEVNYEEDYAVYNGESKFYYTNSNNVRPQNENNLKQIAGVGNSNLISYSGTGAYFLDKINDGVWRLELMPDALWVKDPFGRNSLDKTVGVIKWREHLMKIDLSELQNGFSVEAINSGNEVKVAVDKNQFRIKPGTYILIANNKKKSKWNKADDFRAGQLSDFFAPQSQIDKPYLVHQPKDEISIADDEKITLQYIAAQMPDSISLKAQSGYNIMNIKMEETKAYHYEAAIPSDFLKTGNLNYYIEVRKGSEVTTFPANEKGKVFDWNFHERNPYQIKVVPSDYPIHLFSAKDDTDLLVREWRKEFKLVPTKNQHEYEAQMMINKLFVEDKENLNASPLYDYTFKHFIIDAIEGRKQDLNAKKNLVLKGRSLTEKPLTLQVSLVMDNGSAYGAMLKMESEIGEYSLKLDDLELMKTVTLPRPYPSFLPYYFEHQNPEGFDVERIESIQFSIGPNLKDEEKLDTYGLSLISVSLE